MKGTARALLIAGALLAASSLVFSYGVAVGRYGVFPFELIRALYRSIPLINGDPGDAELYGRWYKRRTTPDDPSTEAARLEQLSALGYLQGYVPPHGTDGARILDANSVYDGLTLFSSGHAPVVYLISLTGEVVHKWEIAFEDVWPGDLPFSPEEEHKQFIRSAHVFPNGDLLAVFEYIGLVKLDRDSRVQWKSLSRNHHDFVVRADGSIVSLVQQPVTPAELANKFPGYRYPDSGIYDDQVAFFDSSGVELKRISLLEAFHRSEYAPFLSPKADQRDVFHANSVDIIESHQPHLGIAAGEVLISLRQLNAVVSLNPEDRRISWMLSGKWRAQHQAQLLENGNILLLDNLGGNRHAPFQLDQSEVLEVDPSTQAVVWRFGGSEEFPFFTHWLGYVQRLPNGNTLITESTQGRILEVTPEGRVVWEYLNPHRVGEDDELIATVMGARRISPDQLAFAQW